MNGFSIKPLKVKLFGRGADSNHGNQGGRVLLKSGFQSPYLTPCCSGTNLLHHPSADLIIMIVIVIEILD